MLLLTNCATKKKYNLNVKKGKGCDLVSNRYISRETPEITFKNFGSSIPNATISIPKKKEILQSSSIKKTTGDCDLIILRNGDEISAKVEEVGGDYIKYKRCDNLNGPTFNTSSGEVFMIKYSNGTKTMIYQKSSAQNQANQVKENNNKKESNTDDSPDVTGILSIIFGGLGLLVLPIIFSTAAVILGLISLGSKRKKKVLGWIGWGLGMIGLIWILAVLAILL